MTTTKINTFNAFRNRNYALFFTGQSVSQIGTWMQRTGVSWVVYTMTHSTFMLGLTIFASQFPSFLFSLYGGVVSDRYNRYKILLITQAASMVQALLLAVLILSNHYVIWEIITLSVMLGIINAFDVPARQPMVHEMVNDKADLSNALALNSAMVNLARLLGPALSGFVLVKFGAGSCFLINAISFIAVLISLLLLKMPPHQVSVVKKKIKAELLEGLSYLKNTPAIGLIILMLSMMNMFVLSYDTLIPVFAKVIFKGDAATFGYISSFIGLGAIISSIFLASLKPGTNLKIILLVNTILLGLCLMLFSYMRNFPVAMLLAILIGFGGMSQSTICITEIQINAAAHMRGRVISFVAMAVFGMLPLGSLLIGIISQQIGAAYTILCQGVLALIIATLFSTFLRKDKLKRKDTDYLQEAEEQIAENL